MSDGGKSAMAERKSRTAEKVNDPAATAAADPEQNSEEEASVEVAADAENTGSVASPASTGEPFAATASPSARYPEHSAKAVATQTSAVGKVRSLGQTMRIRREVQRRLRRKK